jgi:hypothetical protein
MAGPTYGNSSSDVAFDAKAQPAASKIAQKPNYRHFIVMPLESKDDFEGGRIAHASRW